jgi:N-dimethylarginine dimethylaminohydrolase
MYSVYQHWDPLEVCIVGRSYSPEFYSFIKNPRVRSVFEQIAQETEEDYQSLTSLLESFGVEVLRPTLSDNWRDYLNPHTNKIDSPPMYPRDYSIMLGSTWYWRAFGNNRNQMAQWDTYRPNKKFEPEWESVLNHIKDNVQYFVTGEIPSPSTLHWNGAVLTRVGKDLYFGTEKYFEDNTGKSQWLNNNLPDYRHHIVDTGGHSDGVFSVVKPGLIVSTRDIPNYIETFPDWEVLYINNSTGNIGEFLEFKNKNAGKWWVPGQELNDEFTDYVESWLSHWVGYVEETVFDVNMFMINPTNVVVTAYHKELFDKFAEHGITPHIVNLRHRYFWDGGLHCSTSDVSRLGTMQEYFKDSDWVWDIDI